MSDSKKFPELAETHVRGHISIENEIPLLNKFDDLGLQISKDGRVWVCINGIAFLRFRPVLSGYGEEDETLGQSLDTASEKLGDVTEMLSDTGDLADSRWAAGITQIIKDVREIIDAERKSTR